MVQSPMPRARVKLVMTAESGSSRSARTPSSRAGQGALIRGSRRRISGSYTPAIRWFQFETEPRWRSPSLGAILQAVPRPEISMLLPFLLLLVQAPAPEARLVRYPHVSQNNVALTYLGDIWTANTHRRAG